MKSDVNRELVNQLIEEGDRKLKSSKTPFFSASSSLAEDAMLFYRQARDRDPFNKIILKKIKKAEACMKKYEADEAAYEKNKTQSMTSLKR